MVKAKEQTFRSAGFFGREIDLTARQEGPVGVPAGIIGTALRGPAFVPVTLGSFPDFETRFGTLDFKHPGTYAAQKWLENRTALSYMRVLGAGANDTTDDIEKTRLTNQVKSAGFVVTGTAGTGDAVGFHVGAVQMLVAKHEVQTNEALGMPIFTDNDSFGATSASDDVYLVRALIFNTSGSRFLVLNGDEAEPTTYNDAGDLATLDSSSNFKLILSSALGTTAYTASLNPSSENYITKILNINPERFPEKEHLLYLDFAVDDEVATVSSDADSLAIVSGSSNASLDSGDSNIIYRDAFGHFDTRFQSAKTTKFISQPFGSTEFDLFHFEALDDGAYPNKRFKISIADLRASTDPSNPFGTFTVLVRGWEDTDQDPQILETFPGCTLDPRSDDYIGRRIGDRKIKYAFDADSDEERRLTDEGRYANRSTIVRVVMEEAVERRLIPAKALPFGFRGMEVLKTNDLLIDTEPPTLTRLEASGTLDSLSGSIVPPLPYRFKVTRGSISTSGFAGNPGISEEVDGRLYWGTKLERNTSPLNSNTTKKKNNLAEAYSKLHGLRGLDQLVTGTHADTFNESKFTLARVALSNGSVTDLTGTAAEHMKEAAYIRNGNPDATNYKVSDGVLTSRITLGTLVNLTSSADFNRFQTYNKFTNVLMGGFDGLNILDKDAARMNDKASSSDTNGGAQSSYVSPGLAYNPARSGKENNAVFSYRTAARILTDPFTLSANGARVPSVNVLAIPGIKDSFITDFVATKTKEFALALYVMDIPSYDDTGVRLFGDEASAKPDVQKTAENFDTRAIDNNYSAVYFPDIVMTDDVNNRVIEAPASVAAVAALAFNDRVGFPWFAPAGFNRGALSFVRNIDVRLTTNDRDVLQDARINPIANFPNAGFVIFGQKNLQLARSALDRVNIRRLLIEIKRIVSGIARNLVFEQNTPGTRARFVSQVVPQLGLIQAQAGIERFDVIMDERNNSQEDVEQNRLNGRIVVVPTRAVEFIAVDFVVTNAGVIF